MLSTRKAEAPPKGRDKPPPLCIVPAMDGLDSEALAIVEEGLALPPGPARDDFVRTRTADNAPLRARGGQ